jgi:hypothetical protein
MSSTMIDVRVTTGKYSNDDSAHDDVVWRYRAVDYKLKPAVYAICMLLSSIDDVVTTAQPNSVLLVTGDRTTRWPASNPITCQELFSLRCLQDDMCVGGCAGRRQR